MRPKWPVRLGLAISTLIYLVYSCFGIAAPFYWGHHGYHGATYLLRARTSLRFHWVTPATWTGFDPPRPDSIYFHHPIGYHHLLTLALPIFGDHEWVARAVAAAGGLLALWALYALVRRAWSREAGLVAVVIYVTLPVITSFSILSDPMLLAFGCVCWSLNAYLQILERPSRRALVHAAASYMLGGLIMWEAYFLALFLAAHALAYRFTSRGKQLRFGRFRAVDVHTLVAGTATSATMAFHLGFTWLSGQWGDFIASYQMRHSPPSAEWVVNRHSEWLSILFGAAPIFCGLAWLVWFLVRVILQQTRRRDLLPLTFFYINTIYIYLFAEGSSVHLYRVFFYSGFFTLAATDLIVSAAQASRRLGPKWVPLAGALLVGAYLAVDVPHAWHNLIESRELMGTHGQIGYRPEREKWRFVREVHDRTSPDTRVIVDYRHLGARKEMWYYLDRSFDEISSLSELSRLPKLNQSVLLLDETLLDSGDRRRFRELLRHHPVTYFGNFAMIDLRNDKPGEKAYAFVDLPASTSYRFWVSHKWPPLGLVRRAYLPGLCEALTAHAPLAGDEELPPLPLLWNRDPALLACYHNALLATGRNADRLEKAIVSSRGRVPVDVGPLRLIATAREGTRLRLIYRASGAGQGQLSYAVAARGQAAQKVLPSVEFAAASEWQPDFIYVDTVPLAADATVAANWSPAKLSGSDAAAPVSHAIWP